MANQENMYDAFEHALNVNIASYSELYNQPPELMRQFTDIEFYRGDGDYTPYPVIVQNGSGRDITIRCNLDAYEDTWEQLVLATDEATEEDAQKLYVGTGIAWVGMAHMALDAQVKRNEGNARSNALKAILRIQKKMQDEKQVVATITELETTGVIEANLYPIEITPGELNRINRLRYGIGMAYLLHNTPGDVREAISIHAAQNLASYFKNMGNHLIDFALGWGLDKKVEPQAYKQQGISRAFHTLYFAGIRPMDISDILLP